MPKSTGENGHCAFPLGDSVFDLDKGVCHSVLTLIADIMPGRTIPPTIPRSFYITSHKVQNFRLCKYSKWSSVDFFSCWACSSILLFRGLMVIDANDFILLLELTNMLIYLGTLRIHSLWKGCDCKRCLFAFAVTLARRPFEQPSFQKGSNIVCKVSKDI